ncbi:MAG: hypothetical protein SH821_15055 [Phototrophicales bacterium]|nr:hypothetical protein [Phototrophicales bacterium]
MREADGNSYSVIDRLRSMPHILQPDPSESLFICGSAYSSWQGWVEGAWQTVEQVVCDSRPYAPLRGERGGHGLFLIIYIADGQNATA